MLPIRRMTFAFCLLFASSALAGSPPGHWSFPGDIQSHLRTTHRQQTAGLSYEQMLVLHDQLHQGRTRTYSSTIVSPRRTRTTFRLFRR